MEELKSYKIGDIDYGQLCKAFEAAQHLKDSDPWEGHLLSILSALCQIRREIIDTSKKTCSQGADAPTDIIWVISIILALRTIGMLESKARDSTRSQENRTAYRLFAAQYLNLIKQLVEKRNEYVALFPYA